VNTQPKDGSNLTRLVYVPYLGKLYNPGNRKLTGKEGFFFIINKGTTFTPSKAGIQFGDPERCKAQLSS